MKHLDFSTLTRFETTPQTHAGQRILLTWQEGDAAAIALHEHVTSMQVLRGFIDFVGTHSGYLSRLLELHPDVMAAFIRGEAEPFCCDIVHTILTRQTEDIKSELARAYVRKMKQRISLMIALADISETWSLEQVTQTLSAFAEACVQYALEQLYRHAVPKSQLIPDVPLSPNSGIVLLGMGKLGGRELNYSSDIDLIALYDPAKLDFLVPPAHSRFVIRIIQQLASFLQDRQEHGYVFRVDLRLRPDPASTGLAVSLETAIRYYEQVGQNWERAAMIKARPVGGDMAVGEHFLRVLQPFIWRNHLDFAAIEDILSIKRQMQAKEEPDIALPSHHLKTGYGGIREIEFLAQIHQLIWGGRIHELRTRATCEVLHLLTHHALITPEVNEVLQESYRLYRTIEHRLQMRQDQQTHTMPDDMEGCEKLADFCGAGQNIDPFLHNLLTHLRRVHTIFKDAFHESSPLGNAGKLVFTGVDHDSETLHTIRAMGFYEPETISFTIQQWHKGTKRCTRTKRARELLTELVPLILQELAGTVDPDQAFKRFDSFLDALPAGVQPFSLFYSNRELLSLIADIAGNAPVMAKTLSSYPQLLDLLVNHQAQRMPKESEDMQRTLNDWLAMARTEEERVTNFCMFQLEQEFMIGVLLLRQQLTAQTASRYLSHLADTMICAAVKLVTEQLNAKYHMQPDVHFAVIALGKLGTQELMIGSDLDVMFLYDIPSSADLSDEEALSLNQYYNRLTARVINLLSHPSKMGALYEMDTKLRPYGAQGAVAVQLHGFNDYYASAAWIVENLALLQARVVYTSGAMRQPVSDALARAQLIPALPSKISKNIHEIRKKISDQHYSSNAWDIKYVWGGMMDLQWILKGLLAKYSARHPLPEHFSDTAGHIHWLQQIHAIDENQQQLLLEAHRVFHTVLSYLRLCHGNALNEENITDGLKQVLTEVTGMKDYKRLKQHLLRLQAQIYHMYQNLTYM